MDGHTLAKKIMVHYGTADVEQLAAQAGVKVVLQRWYPTTYGEFDRKTKTIFINLNAPIAYQVILAHELGHYFLDLEMPNSDKATHELVAEAFAEVFASPIFDL